VAGSARNCRLQMSMRVVRVSTYMVTTQTRRCRFICPTHTYTEIVAGPVSGGRTYNTELDGDRRTTVSKGDTITGTVWNGNLMILRLHSGKVLDTGDNPNDLTVSDTGMAVVCLGIGLFALLLGLLLLRYASDAIRKSPPNTSTGKDDDWRYSTG
jgi:hypothetical protein